MIKTLRSLYGLKWSPFSSDVPVEGLLANTKMMDFGWRIENGVAPEGGFALISGEPGLGKSVALRMLADRLDGLREVMVGAVQHPQSNLADFYREMGELFGIPLQPHNRWAGFRALREKWVAHIESTLMRPVLLVDEAQEMCGPVLNELRILASTRFDSKSILGVVLAGDNRLPRRLTRDELLPLGSRIRTRLVLEPATVDELRSCLVHRMKQAGNPKLMTKPLIDMLSEHALGNYRMLLQMAAELLAVGAKRELAQLDEKLYLEVFDPAKAKPAGRGARR